jgi:hypothetical protein
MAYRMSQIIHTAAALGIADALGNEALNAALLADRLGVMERPLYRFLRTLGSMGLVKETIEHNFRLTPLGEGLKSNHPSSIRDAILAMSGDYCWTSFQHLGESIRTGRTGMDLAFGEPLFDYLAQRPEEAERFTAAMNVLHRNEGKDLILAYDFHGIRHLVDIGGASGRMIAQILKAHPSMRGSLFDLPHVIGSAKPLLKAEGVEERVTLVPGNFFEAVPEGADLYLLVHVIHDWNAAEAREILAVCAQAMTPQSRLLIVDYVLPEGNESHPGKLIDMVMLTLTGGEERSVSEYHTLLQHAGLLMTRQGTVSETLGYIEARLKDV